MHGAFRCRAVQRAERSVPCRGYGLLRIEEGGTRYFGKICGQFWPPLATRGRMATLNGFSR